LHHQFSIGLEARVNERTRIARELHDTLLQSFQGLMLRFQTVAEMLPARPFGCEKGPRRRSRSGGSSNQRRERCYNRHTYLHVGKSRPGEIDHRADDQLE